MFAACERETDIASTDTILGSGTTAIHETATPSAAGDVGWGAWNTWDTTKDSRVTRDEYDTGFNRVYAEWAGTDNQLSADEARDTWRDFFDSNDDDIIDTDEWQLGSRNWRIPDVEWGEPESWDTNGDDRIDAGEWQAGFDRVAAKAKWTRDELAETWWDFWDGNNDDIIDVTEWNRRTSYLRIDG